MLRKRRLVDGNFAYRRQGQCCLQGDEPARTVTKHEVRARLGQEGINILTFFGHAVLIAMRPAQATPPPI